MINKYGFFYLQPRDLLALIISIKIFTYQVHAVHEGKKTAILKTKKSEEIRKKNLGLGQRKNLSRKRMMIKKKEARGKRMTRREMIATKIKGRIEIEREGCIFFFYS